MSINDEFTPPTIIDYDYYVSQYILPVVDNVAEQRRLIERWIIQCSDQIDVLCGGRVYEEFPNLDLTKEKDKKRAYYLRKAICSLLEYYIDTGKAFVDKNFSSASNVPANINASSEDANFEHKRKDIIKLLTQGNWYQTFNTYTNALDYQLCNGGLHYDFDFDDLVDRLSEVFKRLDNHNSFSTNQVLNNFNLTHIKELVGYNVNTSYIRNFKLDSSVDVSKVIKVSTTGTSSARGNFITVNGVEWFVGGGAGLVTDIRQNGISVLDFQTGVADIDAYKKEDAQRKVYYGETEPENPQDNDVWVNGSGETSTLDYNQLQNKPQINNVELIGNKSLSDIGVYGIYDAAHTDTTTYNASEIDQKISESAAVFRGTYIGGATRPASFDYDTYCKSQMTAEGITPTNADYLFILWTDTNEYDRCRYTASTNTWSFEYTFYQNHLYQHILQFTVEDSELSLNLPVFLTIYNSSSSDITFNELATYIKNNGFENSSIIAETLYLIPMNGGNIETSNTVYGKFVCSINSIATDSLGEDVYAVFTYIKYTTGATNPASSLTIQITQIDSQKTIKLF